ncbi:MAG: hypothetical protein JNK78_19095 [Planctomycetes bacterium]|nr:hypothetical protein [Planctomycetota bacterium]
MRVRRIAIVAAASCFAAIATAQARDERTAAVGMRAHIEQIVLPGGELVAAPAERAAPVVLRVLATWPHGDRFRYDLEWVGLEVGRHDLAKYLARKDGSAVEGVGPIEVAVTGVLKKGRLEPGELEPVAPRRLDGYRTDQIVFGALWLCGLLAILFVGRKRRRRQAPPTPAPTLVDRLRPLVESVAAGRADDAAKAELERLLVACWRSRLGLRDVKADAAISAIRAHGEAGALLRQVEAWLHMPSPPAAIDLEKLLAPYRTLSGTDLEPVAGREGALVR